MIMNGGEQGFVHSPDSENERVAGELQAIQYAIDLLSRQKTEADLMVTQIVRLQQSNPTAMQDRLLEERKKAGDIDARIWAFQEKARKLKQKLH